MSKLLTVVVPVYNTEKYLPKCLDSLIVEEFMDQLEVLVVIDGSPDQSWEVAQAYSFKYPETYIVINKENGGHGSAINKGLELATGKYFKILDSDDWFDNEEFGRFINILNDSDIDLILSDYVLEYFKEGKSLKLNVENFPSNSVFSADDFPVVLVKYDFTALPRATYKTKVLQESKICIPEKLPYDDTFFQVASFIHVKTFLYTNIFLYRYRIGREGQTVSDESLLKNYKNLLSVLDQTNKYFCSYKKSLSSDKKKYIGNILKIYSMMVYKIFLNNKIDCAPQQINTINKFFSKNRIPRFFCFSIVFDLVPYRLINFIYKKYAQLRMTISR